LHTALISFGVEWQSFSLCFEKNAKLDKFYFASFFPHPLPTILPRNGSGLKVVILNGQQVMQLLFDCQKLVILARNFSCNPSFRFILGYDTTH
jgi:hypothetical protein